MGDLKGFEPEEVVIVNEVIFFSLLNFITLSLGRYNVLVLPCKEQLERLH